MTENNAKPAIIFDFGAVLVDWNPYLLYRKLLKSDAEIKAFLDEIGFRDWNLNFDKGYPFTKGVEEHCAKYPQYDELIRAFNSRWLEAMGEQNEDVLQILREIKARGYKVYGLSNWSVEKFNLVKDGFKFLPLLDDYIISGQVNQIKPYPEIYQNLLTRIHRPAEECVFIDDSVENINGAKKLGIQTILFVDAVQLRTELNLLGIL